MTPADKDNSLQVIDLGQVEYAKAYEIQRRHHQAVVEGSQRATLLLVEHPPTITISRRKTASENLLLTRAEFTRQGFDVCETDRGGDVTYHGPGQLVAYPILPLAPLRFNAGRYIRFLEEVIIQSLAEFDVAGQRDDCATGVWVRLSNSQTLPDNEPPQDAPNQTCRPFDPNLAKIAAIGVRISRGVTLHGLALNVNSNMSHFQTIIPCGLAGRPVTRLADLLKTDPPQMDTVKESVTRNLTKAYQRQIMKTASEKT